MKRLVLAVAAVVAGSGCIVTSEPCDRTITVDWPQFQAADGTIYPSSVSGCAAAAIPQVDVYLNDTLVDHFPCSTGGMTITGVPDGVQTVTVEGVEASGRIAFRDDFTVDAGGCGDHPVTAIPSEGYLDLAYYFTPVNQCAANPSFIWFAVYDQIVGNDTAGVGPGNTFSEKTAYVCSANDTIFPLPTGPYTVRWVEETVQTGPSTFAVTATNCAPAPTTVNVAAATTTTFPVALVDSTFACQ